MPTGPFPTPVILLLSVLWCVILADHRPQKKLEKIIAGDDTNIEDFPYMAQVRRRKSHHFSACGGSIISRTFVLTAAHCVHGYPRRNITIQVGATRRLSNEGDIYKSEGVIIHENYNQPSHFANDIALIKVKGKIKYGPHVQPIRLAPRDYDLVVGSSCEVTGWGYTQPRKSSRTKVMQHVTVFIMGNQTCSVKSRSYRGEFMVCIVPSLSRPGTSCMGDSGGPLVQSGIQVGIVSYGKHDCEPGYPEVFMKVSKYVSWIREQMGSD